MKKRKLLALVACSPLLLTGCNNQKTDAITTIENNVITVVKNDSSISNGENLGYKFTGYEVWQNYENQTLDVFGKLFDNSQNSYLKLSYDNVDFSNYNFSNEVDSYKSIADIVKNYKDCDMQNIAVYDFNNFEKIFGSAVPQNDSNGHNIDAYEVLSIDNMNYNEKTNQIEFNSNIVADYKWQTMYTTFIMSGKVLVPITNTMTHHNYETYSYDVKYNMLEEDYNKYKDSTKDIINLLENYVQMGLTNEYTINESEKTLNPALKKAEKAEVVNTELGQE